MKLVRNLRMLNAKMHYDKSKRKQYPIKYTIKFVEVAKEAIYNL